MRASVAPRRFSSLNAGMTMESSGGILFILDRYFGDLAASRNDPEDARTGTNRATALLCRPRASPCAATPDGLIPPRESPTARLRLVGRPTAGGLPARR